ncbi:MAG: DNA-processing protein DprA [Candidatus Omnitrophota bacterium]|nr:DNA-processing protein DprA [Candidatus Omnitrophota bacterium]
MNVVQINNLKYPKLLKQINKPPQRFYYKGVWDSSLFDNCLAVVGSRQMTGYGRRVTDQLVSKVARAGITIVSGFMYGIDAQAHKAALLAGGRTIAVMPCGIDLIHPEYQEELYKQILANGGLIISEFEGDFLPARWTYPRRNRIVAGLSQATLVVEAGQRSGSLITAALTKKYGRKLFAVPGPITSAVSQGTLQLIREGAGIVTGANDILGSYGLYPQENGRDNIASLGLSRMEQIVLKKLAQEPCEIDELSRVIKVSAAELGTVLSLMHIRGIVSKEEGKYYVS